VTTPQGLAARVLALRTALQHLGDALASPAVEPLTSAEAALATAVADLSSRTLGIEQLPAADRAALRDELLAARGSLARCRRLGDSLSAFVHASLQAQGLVGGYDRRGEEALQVRATHFGVRG
jgi:hypothetical protein